MIPRWRRDDRLPSFIVGLILVGLLIVALLPDAAVSWLERP